MDVTGCWTSSGHNGEMLMKTWEHCVGRLYVQSGKKLLRSLFQKFIYYLSKTITCPITQCRGLRKSVHTVYFLN